MWWVWLILIGTNVLFITGSILQEGFGKQFGTNPLSNSGLIFITVSMLIISVLLLSSSLHTYINTDIAYTTSGNKGLQLILENGRKVLIGTQQPEYLEEILIKLGKTELMKNG